MSEYQNQAEEDLRNRQIAIETTVRNRFQLLWPAQHALAWLITGSEEAVQQIDDLRSFHQRSAWDVLHEIAAIYLREEDSTEQVLWVAFDRLKTALGRGLLTALRVPPPYTQASDLDRSAFAKGGLTMNFNSCGFFGVSFEGDAHDFVIMWPDDVKAIFPGALTPAQTTEDESVPAVIRKRRTQYDWEQLEAAATARIEYEGGFFPTWRQADLEGEMADWAGENWEKTPSESAIRLHVAAAFARYEAAKARVI